MAVAEDSNQAGGSPEGGGGDFSLGAAIAFANDFSASAAVFEMGVAIVLSVAGTLNASVKRNDARIARLERSITSLSARAASTSNNNGDELNRPVGGSGTNAAAATSSTVIAE